MSILHDLSMDVRRDCVSFAEHFFICQGRQGGVVSCFRTCREPIHGGAGSASCLARSRNKTPHPLGYVREYKSMDSEKFAWSIVEAGCWTIGSTDEMRLNIFEKLAAAVAACVSFARPLPTSPAASNNLPILLRQIRFQVDSYNAS